MLVLSRGTGGGARGGGEGRDAVWAAASGVLGLRLAGSGQRALVGRRQASTVPRHGVVGAQEPG